MLLTLTDREAIAGDRRGSPLVRVLRLPRRRQTRYLVAHAARRRILSLSRPRDAVNRPRCPYTGQYRRHRNSKTDSLLSGD